MVGGGFAGPSVYDAEEYELSGLENGEVVGRHTVQWVGTPGVKGPKWAKFPLLTVGMLGIQCVWSIEMGYASPFLLELGLSKSFMSLVFMAGPFSGLIVQPLIGAFADRSRSRYGRRRPFMLVGTGVCAVGMMMLGWAREIGGVFGSTGNGLAIAVAVLAIYLIDFSINAVMSVDRSLVVDTLPPREQEQGAAWGGRMFGFGGLAGFFVGNLDLPPYLPFLGKTQLQILSFVTSLILLTAHSFTSWAVTERVLLRDDRPHTQNSLLGNLKAIWDNVWTLPPGIRSVCFIQFWNFFAWYPVLFFTSIWIARIYTENHAAAYGSSAEAQAQLAADAVRAGARALFCQAIINVIASVGLPPLVAETGVLPPEEGEGYERLGNGHAMADGDDGYDGAPSSAAFKRQTSLGASGGLAARVGGWAEQLRRKVKSGEAFRLPIKGLTVVDVWTITLFIFSACLLSTWFITSVGAAYTCIGLTGLAWALTQWAPYSLLGELVLLDGTIDRSGPNPVIIRTRPSTDRRSPRSPSPLPRTSFQMAAGSAVSSASSRSSPIQSRHGSARSSLDGLPSPTHSPSFSPNPSVGKFDPPVRLTPLVIQKPQMEPVEIGDHSIVLRHSDDFEADEEEEHDVPNRPTTPLSADRPPASAGGKDTADKAGIILGIHNVFIVIPQFIVTGFSSIVFFFLEPASGSGGALTGEHPLAGGAPGGVLNSTMDAGSADLDGVLRRGMHAIVLGKREGAGPELGDDSVGFIFRMGGVAAAIAGVVCWRMGRRFKRGQGL